MAALASLIVFGAAVGGTAAGAGSRAAGAWFDAFDQNGDGEWGEDEVKALDVLLDVCCGRKMENMEMCDDIGGGAGLRAGQ